MKCIQAKYGADEIQRVSNEEAERQVKTGKVAYRPKHLFKAQEAIAKALESSK